MKRIPKSFKIVLICSSFLILPIIWYVFLDEYVFRKILETGSPRNVKAVISPPSHRKVEIALELTYSSDTGTVYNSTYALKELLINCSESDKEIITQRFKELKESTRILGVKQLVTLELNEMSK